MAKERRKDVSSDDDSSILAESCFEAYESKGKRRSKKNSQAVNRSRRKGAAGSSNSSQLFTGVSHKPKKGFEKNLTRIGFYIWTFAVVASVMSLLGFPFSSLLPGSQLHSSGADPSRRILRSSDAEEDTSTASYSSWAQFPSNLFPNTGSLGLGSVTGGSASSEEMGSEKDSELEESEEDFEEIPQQILPSTPKQGNQLNKPLEKALACEEETCNESCNQKIKPKCAKSASCRKERERVCRRRCRKQRCEDRCKDEPKFGYVEREQRMEKCKDECSGPTAVHNKCIKKCHSMFKPCKNRCHEIASKFVCNKAKVPLIATPLTDNEEDEEVI